MAAAGFWLIWAARLMTSILAIYITVICFGTAIAEERPMWLPVVVALPIDVAIFCLYKAAAALIKESL